MTLGATITDSLDFSFCFPFFVPAFRLLAIFPFNNGQKAEGTTAIP
jgi:hypothetical protein